MDQHFGGAQQTHTVLARQQDGLLHHPITDGATQLLFHVLHIGLEREKGLNQSIKKNPPQRCTSFDLKTRLNNGRVRMKKRNCSRG